jgi:hypothetical protein
MLSNETDSTKGFKIFSEPALGIYGIAAGSMDTAASVFGAISADVRASGIGATHGLVYSRLHQVVHGYRTTRFTADVLQAEFMFIGQPSLEDRQEIHRRWQQYDMQTEMILAAFPASGSAILYSVNLCGVGSGPFVHSRLMPGHWSIGTGAYNASLWLNYRRQHLGMTVRQSALHAFEASNFAASAPTVNRDPEMVIATRQGCFSMHGDYASPDSPISLRELRRLAIAYGPRKTNRLGFPMPSNPQKSEDQP